MRAPLLSQMYAQQYVSFPEMSASAVLTSSAMPEVEPETGPVVSHIGSSHSEYTSLTTLRLLLPPLLFNILAYGSITGNDELQVSSRERVNSTSTTQIHKSAVLNLPRRQDQLVTICPGSEAFGAF